MAKRYIRNYTVIQKNVKVGESNKMINYLLNEEHKNHKETTIHCEDNSELFSDLLFLRKQKNDFNYMKNKKGGRKLKDIAKSLTFNIPPDFKPTLNDTKQILNHIHNGLLDLFNQYDINMYESDLFTAIHQQSNTHIHILLPMLDNTGKNIRRFKEPGFLVELKILFTESVDKVMNTEIEQYEQLSKEELKHNQNVRELNRLKNDYEEILKQLEISNPEKVATAFFIKQIKVIDTLLKFDNIDTNKLEVLNKNVGTVNKHKSSITVNPMKFK